MEAEFRGDDSSPSVHCADCNIAVTDDNRQEDHFLAKLFFGPYFMPKDTVMCNS